MQKTARGEKSMHAPRHLPYQARCGKVLRRLGWSGGASRPVASKARWVYVEEGEVCTRTELVYFLDPFPPLPASCHVAVRPAGKATPLLPPNWHGLPALRGTPQPVIGGERAMEGKGDRAEEGKR